MQPCKWIDTINSGSCSQDYSANKKNQSPGQDEETILAMITNINTDNDDNNEQMKGRNKTHLMKCSDISEQISDACNEM